MSIFANSATMTAVFIDLAERLQDMDPAAAAKLLKSGLVIAFEASDPDAQLTIDASKTPLALHFDATTAKPQITVRLSADVLHCILLNELGIRKALGRGLIELKGPIWKVVALGDLFDETQKIYPDVMGQHGLPTTCPDSLA